MPKIEILNEEVEAKLYDNDWDEEQITEHDDLSEADYVFITDADMYYMYMTVDGHDIRMDVMGNIEEVEQ